eukprot:jgi/Chlat1/7921/Chrsp68S07356
MLVLAGDRAPLVLCRQPLQEPSTNVAKQPPLHARTKPQAHPFTQRCGLLSRRMLKPLSVDISTDIVHRRKPTTAGNRDGAEDAEMSYMADERTPLLPQKGDSSVETGQNGQDGFSSMGRPRHLIGYWICGLLNNFQYVVFLTAAEDFLTGYSGAVLLADILPALLAKGILPLFMHRLGYRPRVFAVVLLAITAFLVVASAKGDVPVVLFGVVLASLASGIGENTFLASTSRFSKNTVSAWSSGTGAAGLAGAGAWVILHNVLSLSTQHALLLMAPLPLVIAFAYLTLLEPGTNMEATIEVVSKVGDSEQGLPLLQDGTRNNKDVTGWELLQAVQPVIARYMVPLVLVYYLEYTINQALFLPLGLAIYGASSTKGACHMYTYLQTTYQVGVFVSRSSVNVFPLKRLWPLPVFQGINLLLALTYILAAPSTEGVLGSTIPLFAVYVMVLWEGLLGGACYVNAFTLISASVPSARREFALGVSSLADSVGISLAAVTSLLLEQPLLHHLGVQTLKC